jgi:hypothetical protein
VAAGAALLDSDFDSLVVDEDELPFAEPLAEAVELALLSLVEASDFAASLLASLASAALFELVPFL